MVEDLKVQLSQQQQAATDAAQASASSEEALQQIKASSTTEVQAWQVKADELKEVRWPCEKTFIIVLYAMAHAR